MPAFANDRFENVLFLGASRPVEERRPAFENVQPWNRLAEAKLEEAMARMDQLLLQDAHQQRSGVAEIVAGFMTWTRQSLRPFADDRAPLATAVRAQEAMLWDRMATMALAGLDGDPESADRFLRAWLSVVREAVLTGNASLYAEPR